MAAQPLKIFGSSSPDSEEAWDSIFRNDRGTQTDYEECDACVEDDYSENEDEQ